MFHHVCAKYPRKEYFSGGFLPHMCRSAFVVWGQKLVHVSPILKIRIHLRIVIAPFICSPYAPMFGKSIDFGVFKNPQSLRNAIFFWRKSASSLLAKNLLVEFTALMVGNFTKTHPKTIGSIMIRTVTCGTDACALDSCCFSSSSLV